MSVFCAIPLVAKLVAACAVIPPAATGYVEGEHVLLAPVEVSSVRSVSVRRGDMVKAGDMLAALDDNDAQIAVAAAGAQLEQAKSQLANLREGRRPEEIAVLAAARTSAAAQLAEAERTVARISSLGKRGIATTADTDQATTQLDLAKAQLAQADANLAVAKLPARQNEILAATHQVDAAKAALDQAEWRLSKRIIAAPANGEVSDIILNAGDTAGPSSPVIAMLPEGAVKLKLYFPEPLRARIKAGDLIAIHCDGCGDGLQAAVSFVSSEPEFTPPVIYSLENRQKLVFLVEAQETGDAKALKPGQIVDADLLDEAR